MESDLIVTELAYALIKTPILQKTIPRCLHEMRHFSWLFILETPHGKPQEKLL